VIVECSRDRDSESDIPADEEICKTRKGNAGCKAGEGGVLDHHTAK
jgi:hypothetical protein